MTQDELYSLLKSIGLDVSIAHGEHKTFEKPPYIAYAVDRARTWGSDNKNEFKETTYWVDLYTAVKDVELQARLEKLFDDRGINYDQMEGVIAEKRLYRVLYILKTVTRIRRDKDD